MIRSLLEAGSASIGGPAALTDLYRLLLLRAEGSELLVVDEQSALALPWVEIEQGERVAEQLNPAVRERYGISAICLFSPELPNPPSGGPLYQVMEAVQPNSSGGAETRWVSVDALSQPSFADNQDFVALSAALHQMRESWSGKSGGPFVRPGWIDELLSWLQSEIDPHGLQLTGMYRQLNASPTFALLRFETNGPAVWFKAIGEPNLREFPISVALSKRFPGFVPAVIAAHSAWNGWVTTEDRGTTLDEVQDIRAWPLAARRFADLQIASTQNTAELLEAGCADLRVSSLVELVDPFLERMTCLMEQQPRIPPSILDPKELLLLGARLKEALCELADLRIPDSLGHLDFNPGNIVCSSLSCVFLDWAEAYIGPPFLTLQYLRQHLARLWGKNILLDADVVEAYAAEWEGMFSPESVSSALDLAPALAVFAYASGTSAWREPAALRQPGTAAYLRSLTRRMHFELLQLQDRRHRCSQ